jgi:anti-sigma-K factor RskA
MNEILYESLRKYRLNQLSAEEKAAFEQQLNDDPVFAAGVAEYATMLAAIQQEGDRQLETQLSEQAKILLQTEEQPNLQTSKVRTMTTFRRILYAAAAVIVLLLVALPFWLNNRDSQTPEQIFAAHFSVPSVPEVRDATPQAWREAYTKGDYQQAVASLNTLLADQTFTQRSEASLYLGVSQLALGNASEALAAFQKVSQDSYDWESAQWYSALALLKLGKKDEAKIIVDDIVHRSGHPHNKEAKEVFSELK